MATVMLNRGVTTKAQSTATPQTTATPLWEINQNLCPVDKRCGQVWRTSPDGQKLFLYTPENRTLYVLTHDSSVPTQSYDMSSLFPLTQDQFFDFLPISDHVLVYFDRERDRLASVDLTTQENQAYVIEHGMRSCTSSIDLWPPFHAFYLLPDGHTLIVCRVDETDELLHISKIDLETNELEDILVLEHVGYPYGYVRIIAGLDGAIYIEPAAGDFWAIIPGYSFPQLPGRYIARWDIETSSWSFLRITEPLLISGSGNIPRSPSFIGVDGQSNMYFWEANYDNDIETTTITKVNLEGGIIWRASNDSLGLNPGIPTITSDGQLIVINIPPFDSNTTSGTKINTVTIPDSTATPALTPTLSGD